MTNEFTAEPQDKTYKFKAQIYVKENWVNDVNIQGHASRYKVDMCYLLPEHSDQGDACLSAWLPDLALEPGQEAHHNNRVEVALVLGSPINGPARGAFMRANHNCSDHHIQIMTVGVEDDIKRLKLNGRNVLVTVLPAKDENEADSAKDTQRDLHAE